MKLAILTHKLLIVSVAVVIFGFGYRAGQYNAGKSLQAGPAQNFSVTNLEEKNVHNIDFSLFWETWNALEQHYVDKEKLKTKTLYYGAIKGMVASVGDAYTFFLTPEENKQSKDDLEGTFEGIGAELGLKNNDDVVSFGISRLIHDDVE